MFPTQLSRRDFVRQTSAAAGVLAAGSLAASAPPARRPQVAAIFTELRFRSHAFNFLENFLGPYGFRGQRIEPPVDVVALYADQFPENDLAREISRRFNLPLYPSIEAALCRGGKQLAVDAVLSIVEHGEYPTNDRQQKLYPRKEFFDAAVAVMKRAGRFVPLFNDKHLSYRWDWAKAMYDTARQLGIPLMAGSSVPLAQRRPPLEIPAGAEFTEAIAVHGGGVEVYDFHGLELLQSLVESRRGGETGISHIEFLKGDALWKAAEQGRWSRSLADAALAAELGQAPADYSTVDADKMPDPPHGVLVTYRDGLRGLVLKVGKNSSRWNFACRLKGETAPRATALFNGPWGNRNLFQALSHAVQHFFVHGREPYPIERTLLVSGALDAAMTSWFDDRPVATPHLEFAYRPINFDAFRENGDSWKRIPAGTPQPEGFRPGESPNPR